MAHLKRFIYWFVRLIPILLINLNSVSAVSVGVNPAEIVFNCEENVNLTKGLYIINTGSEATTYKIYADTENILINPPRITVQSGDFKVVYISYMPKEHKIGNLSYTLYVKSLTNSAQFSVSAGIKVPIRIYNAEKIISQEEGDLEGKDEGGNLPIISRVIDFMVEKEQTLLFIIFLLTVVLVLKIWSKSLKPSSEKKGRGLRSI